MATVELVRALKELMTRGLWGTKDDLMREVIPVRPSNFAQLTSEDAFRILCRGNDIAVNYGKSPVYIEPPISNNSDAERKETVGRCVDLWKNDDMPSDTPKRRPIRSDDPHKRRDIFSFPKPIRREDYFNGNFTMDFECGKGNMKETIIDTYPNYEATFSSPVRCYPGDIVSPEVSETKIEVVGSAEVEEVEA